MTPEQLVLILGAMTALATAIAAVIVQLVALKRQIDGRLTQLLEQTADANMKIGELRGRDFTRAPDRPVG